MTTVSATGKSEYNTPRLRADFSRRSMRSSRTGSWSPGVNEVKTFILVSQNLSEILIEILIELSVRTQTAHLLVLVAMKQGTQGNDLVTATEENGNEAADGDRCPAQRLVGFQAFRENQARIHETQNDHRDSHYEEHRSQSSLQAQSNLLASNGAL